MTDPWFTTKGKEGSLRVTRRGDSWYVVSPALETATKCIFNDNEEPSQTSDDIRLTAVVSHYTIGEGDNPNHVFLNSVTEDKTIQTNEKIGERIENSTNRTASADTGEQRSSSSQSKTTQSDSESTQAAQQHESSLDKIAQEKLAGERFTVEQEEESLVGGAKKKAKNQGRDPAIDPRLQEQEGEEDE
jgi:hypothetical protein